jgi:predicted phage tail protein
MRSFGWLCTILGALLMIAGVVVALRPLIEVYSGALSDPLADTGASDGPSVAKAMAPGLVLAGVGLPLALVGLALRIRSRFRRTRPSGD